MMFVLLLIFLISFCLMKVMIQADQPTANDPLEMSTEPITRSRAKKLKEAFNRFVQHI